jgi:predicted membrane-bound spermidine synthase
MINPNLETYINQNKRVARRITRLLSTAFFLSGSAALIYQVVWQRLLTVYYGVGPISFTLVVTLFMLGLGLGSLFGAYLSEKVERKLQAFFILESGIGIFGIISPAFLDFLGRNTAGSPYGLSFLYMIVFLAIPTFLMGCTLPLLVKIFSGMINDFLQSVSFLYFINTIGAACGSLAGSYLIISFFGLDIAVQVAAVLNLVVIILIFISTRYTNWKMLPFLPMACPEQAISRGAEMKMGMLATCVGITGFLAIGYEIIWFRVIGILLKDSPYAFSSVLSVYLTGIGLGSLVMNRYIKHRSSTDIKKLFFTIQFLVGVTVFVIFVGYFYLTKYSFLSILTTSSFSIDRHPLLQSLFDISSSKAFLGAAYQMLDVFFWPFVFVLIPTMLMGASFPVVSMLAFSATGQEGKAVGHVYFYTILGNALGGIVTGFVLLPWVGTEITLVLFISVGFCFVLPTHTTGRTYRHGLKRNGILFALVVANFLLFPGKTELYTLMHSVNTGGFDRYIEEGVDGVVATFQKDQRILNFINGLSHGSRPNLRYTYETIETIAHAESLEKVLVIGYGTGTIVETFLKRHEVQELVIVELNRTLIANLRKMSFFREQLSDPRIRLVLDDGRRYLLRSPERFDVITIDALRTRSAYSNNLYSADFFQIVRDRLSTGGVFLTWRDEHKVVPRTLASVFEYIEMFKDFSISSNHPTRVNQARRNELMETLSETDLNRLPDYRKHSGDRTHIIEMTRGYPINRDWKPWTEYYIGLETYQALKVFQRKAQSENRPVMSGAMIPLNG